MSDPPSRRPPFLCVPLLSYLTPLAFRGLSKTTAPPLPPSLSCNSSVSGRYLLHQLNSNSNSNSRSSVHTRPGRLLRSILSFLGPCHIFVTLLLQFTQLFLTLLIPLLLSYLLSALFFLEESETETEFDFAFLRWEYSGLILGILLCSILCVRCFVIGLEERMTGNVVVRLRGALRWVILRNLSEGFCGVSESGGSGTAIGEEDEFRVSFGSGRGPGQTSVSAIAGIEGKDGDSGIIGTKRGRIESILEIVRVQIPTLLVFGWFGIWFVVYGGGALLAVSILVGIVPMILTLVAASGMFFAAQCCVNVACYTSVRKKTRERKKEFAAVIHRLWDWRRSVLQWVPEGIGFQRIQRELDLDRKCCCCPGCVLGMSGALYACFAMFAVGVLVLFVFLIEPEGFRPVRMWPAMLWVWGFFDCLRNAPLLLGAFSRSVRQLGIVDRFLTESLSFAEKQQLRERERVEMEVEVKNQRSAFIQLRRCQFGMTTAESRMVNGELHWTSEDFVSSTSPCTLRIGKDEIVAFSGNLGAARTLCRGIAGHLPITSGDCWFDCRDNFPIVAVLTSSPPIERNLTVRENILCFGTVRKAEDEILDCLRLTHLLDWADLRVSDILVPPPFFRVLLSAARALLHRPSIVVFEPEAVACDFVDFDWWDAATRILVTNDEALLEQLDCVFVVARNGEIVAEGRFAEVEETLSGIVLDVVEGDEVDPLEWWCSPRRVVAAREDPSPSQTWSSFWQIWCQMGPFPPRCCPCCPRHSPVGVVVAVVSILLLSLVASYYLFFPISFATIWLEDLFDQFSPLGWLQDASLLPESFVPRASLLPAFPELGSFLDVIGDLEPITMVFTLVFMAVNYGIFRAVVHCCVFSATSRIVEKAASHVSHAPTPNLIANREIISHAFASAQSSDRRLHLAFVSFLSSTSGFLTVAMLTGLGCFVGGLGIVFLLLIPTFLLFILWTRLATPAHQLAENSNLQLNHRIAAVASRTRVFRSLKLIPDFVDDTSLLIDDVSRWEHLEDSARQWINLRIRMFCILAVTVIVLTAVLLVAEEDSAKYGFKKGMPAALTLSFLLSMWALRVIAAFRDLSTELSHVVDPLAKLIASLPRPPAVEPRRRVDRINLRGVHVSLKSRSVEASFDLSPGQRIGVISEDGVTTSATGALLRFLLGFEEAAGPDDYTIDGIPVSTMTHAEFRSRVVAYFPDIVDGPVSDLLGSTNMNDCRAALKLVGLSSLLTGLGGPKEEIVASSLDRETISLLSFARILVMRPRLILFDMMSRFPRTNPVINSLIRGSHLADSCVVLFPPNFGYCADCDLVIVLASDGSVVLQGTPTELLGSGDDFAMQLTGKTSELVRSFLSDDFVPDDEIGGSFLDDRDDEDDSSEIIIFEEDEDEEGEEEGEFELVEVETVLPPHGKVASGRLPDGVEIPIRTVLFRKAVPIEATEDGDPEEEEEG